MEAHFSTKDYEDLSADSQSKKWNEIDTNDIAFWFEKYPEMAKKVVKDHPTKIPYKNLRTK